MRSLPPLVLFAITTALSAQTYKVLPAGFTSTEGKQSSAYPFAYLHTRSQQIWNGPALRGIRRQHLEGSLAPRSLCAGCDYPYQLDAD